MWCACFHDYFELVICFRVAEQICIYLLRLLTLYFVSVWVYVLLCALCVYYIYGISWWCSIWFYNKRYSYQMCIGWLLLLAWLHATMNSTLWLHHWNSIDASIGMRVKKNFQPEHTSIIKAIWLNEEKNTHAAHEHTSNIIGCNDAVWSVICKVVIQLYNFLTLFFSFSLPLARSLSIKCMFSVDRVILFGRAQTVLRLSDSDFFAPIK